MQYAQKQCREYSRSQGRLVLQIMLNRLLSHLGGTMSTLSFGVTNIWDIIQFVNYIGTIAGVVQFLFSECFFTREDRNLLSSIYFYYASERFEPVKILKKRNPDIPLFYGISRLFVTFKVTHIQLVEATRNCVYLRFCKDYQWRTAILRHFCVLPFYHFEYIAPNVCQIPISFSVCIIALSLKIVNSQYAEDFANRVK